MQFPNSFSSQITTSDRTAFLNQDMQPNRKARREQERRANKNHAEELKERQRHPHKKVTWRPPILMQPGDPSFLKTQYDRVVDVVDKCVSWLAVTMAKLLESIMVAFTIFMAYFSGTRVKTIAQKSKSDAVVNKTVIPSSGEAASGISKSDQETTSEELHDVGSLQSFGWCCVSSDLLTKQLDDRHQSVSNGSWICIGRDRISRYYP
jgi:hypothetical protein